MTKQTVDTLLINGWLVTMDTHSTVYPKGAVAIKNNEIVAVGPAEKLRPHISRNNGD